ncbi:hypothetical protein ACQ4LE_001636 [Meloidogyne hapla]|uniref:AAA domain-containing protein n=1 Tax=Meloidogyne hapla TaxID=6305 RepID=A0A1I8BX93_MELHA
MKLRSKTSTSSRLSVSSHKSVITSPNKEKDVKGSEIRQEHQKDELISSMPSTSKTAPQLSTTPLSTYGTRRSSTASTEFSPDSPGFGRVAKSNARLLNGLDLTRKSAGSSSYLGTAVVLPELKTFELSEKCPTLSKLLKTCGTGISDAARKSGVEQQLTSLQFELEELCAQNIDYQSTIHGEITYLTTGEYPTVNLKNRPMPIYCCVGKEEMQKLAERVKRSVPTPTSMSLADLGILSSPEDEEAPHILDVPHRFWTWAKEYLRHISLDYVNEYKEKMLDRFSEENIIGNYCSQHVNESASTSHSSAQQSSKTLPNITPSISAKSSTKRKRVVSSSESSTESSASICTTPLKHFYSVRGRKGRFKKRRNSSKSFVVSEKKDEITSEQNYRTRATSFQVGSNKSEKGLISKNLTSPEKILIDIDCTSIITPRLTPNGLHPRLNNLNKNNNNSNNGIITNKTSQNGGKQQKQLKETPKIIKKQKFSKTFERAESNLKSYFKLMSEEDDDFDEEEEREEEEEDKKDVEDEEENEEEEEDELVEKSLKGVNGNGTSDRRTKSMASTSSTVKDPDNEISVLLHKKQERLRELFYKSRPTIETLYARVLKEYAVHEAIHRMDEADNKLYQVASKLEHIASLSREQRQEAQAALKEHNLQYAAFHRIKK